MFFCPLNVNVLNTHFRQRMHCMRQTFQALFEVTGKFELRKHSLSQSAKRKIQTFQEHSYTHSGVTDAYECNWCGKKFRFGSSWSAHKMKYHPAEMAEARERLERIKRNAKQKAGEGQVQIWNQV